jgi:hypothetical protein
MDFDSYYVTQAKNNLPVFRGAAYQRGYGFGNVFRRFFRWVVPILKENAMPVIKNLGKETLKGAINVATDALDGQDIKSSAKSNLKKSLQNISTQYGNGKKRKKTVFKETKTFKKPNHSTNKKKKRRLDIFD